jgi:uncharacterized protein
MDKKHILIGECKWSKVNNPGSVLKELEQKASQFPLVKGRNIVTALFIKETSVSNIPAKVFLPSDVLKRLKI